jgi:hypothetical protein
MKRKYIKHIGRGSFVKRLKSKWTNMNPTTKKIIKGTLGAAAGLASLYGAYKGSQKLGFTKYPNETKSSVLDRNRYWKDRINIKVGRTEGIPAFRQIRALKPRAPSVRYRFDQAKKKPY